MIAVFEMLFSGKPVRAHVHIDLHIIFDALLPAIRLGKTKKNQTLRKDHQSQYPQILYKKNQLLIHNKTENIISKKSILSLPARLQSLPSLLFQGNDRGPPEAFREYFLHIVWSVPGKRNISALHRNIK